MDILEKGSKVTDIVGLTYRKYMDQRSLQGRHIAGKKIGKHTREEFGPGRGEFIFCPHGEAVYYKKSWHHIAKFFTSAPFSKQDKNVSFKLCPVHEMIKNKQHEGEITIQHIPAAVKSDLTHLITHMGEQAMRIDVLDRVLEMKWTKDQMVVTTSENQLAQKIGRKIVASFKKYTVKTISRPKGGDSDMVFVDISFFAKQST